MSCSREGRGRPGSNVPIIADLTSIIQERTRQDRAVKRSLLLGNEKVRLLSKTTSVVDFEALQIEIYTYLDRTDEEISLAKLYVNLIQIDAITQLLVRVGNPEEQAREFVKNMIDRRKCKVKDLEKLQSRRRRKFRREIEMLKGYMMEMGRFSRQLCTEDKCTGS